MLTLKAVRDYVAKGKAEALLQGDERRLGRLQQLQALMEELEPAPQAVPDLAAAIAQGLAQAEKRQDQELLLRWQGLAGLLMEPAELHGDQVTFDQFRGLAAHAANAAEEIEEELERGRRA